VRLDYSGSYGGIYLEVLVLLEYNGLKLRVWLTGWLRVLEFTVAMRLIGGGLCKHRWSSRIYGVLKMGGNSGIK